MCETAVGTANMILKAKRGPQEKKQLSLKKDRRNGYGENAKSSRKNIPLFKAISHRKVRNAAAQDSRLFDRLTEDEVESRSSILVTRRLQKGRWKKSADTSLQKIIIGKLKRRQQLDGK
jgi:hypothetical protein